MHVSTLKHGWAPEMQCLRLVGLHPPRGDSTCNGLHTTNTPRGGVTAL